MSRSTRLLAILTSRLRPAATRLQNAAAALGKGRRLLRAQAHLLASRYRDVVRTEKSQQQSTNSKLEGMGVGFLVAGVLYLGLFAPLAWQSARALNVDPVSALLLLELPQQLDTSFFAPAFPQWSAPDARPVIYAVAALYGAASIVAFLVLAAGGLLRIALTANGIFFGFLLTTFVATDVLAVLPRSSTEGRLLYLKLAYVMLSYYAAWAGTALVSRDDMARQKYEFLLTGTQALLSGWILAKGLGGAAPVYAGAIYLGCTFVTLAASESLFRRVRRVMIATFGGHAAIAFDQEQYLPPAMFASALRAAWTEERAVIIASATISIVFPVLICALYRIGLESRW